MTISNIDSMLATLKSDIRELGRDAAAGGDAKAKLALKVVRAAHEGYIISKDAEILYSEYVTAQSKKAMHEHSTGGMKANISKLSTIISFGSLPSIDAPALLDKVIDIRNDLRGGDEKLKAAFDTFLDVAKAQIKSPDELSDDELRDLCIKDAKEKSLIDKLVEDYKRMSKRHEELPSPSIEAAIHAIGDAIHEAGGELPATTKEAKAKAAFIAKAASFGLIVQ